MSIISDRISYAMALRGLKQADLVRITGIGKSSICMYLSGSYDPKQKNIYSIANALDVNEAWLMGYSDDMERKTIRPIPSAEPQPFSYALKNEYPNLSESDISLLQSMAKQLNDAKEQKGNQ